ncbi:MAG: biopolymer transporter ExbD [Marinilabiliaceae bacterium]|jgi:biopolymer transport protein ExbD|nr:biopolymer transporter ExbD [Marinilabiliaceae bacterium]
MAIRSRNKISVSFSMAGMSDIVFLLLIFFMITSTLIHPTALKLLLPKGANQANAKPLTTVSITRDLQYYVEDQPVDFSNLEAVLAERIGNAEDTYVSLHVDKTVPIEYAVKVLNIAKDNKYKLILATSPK